MRDFCAYYRRVLRRGFTEGRTWGRDQLIGVAIAILILLGKLVYDGKAPKEWFSDLLPFLVALGGWAVFHMVRAPWKLDQDARAIVAKVQAEKGATQLEAEMERVKALRSGPDVFIRVTEVNQCIVLEIENLSSGIDAVEVRLDQLETPHFSVEAKMVQLLKRSSAQELDLRVTSKTDGSISIEPDIRELLLDSRVGDECVISFTVRYRESWGLAYYRMATLSANGFP